MNHEPEMIDPALRKILDEDAERIDTHYRQHVAHRQWQFLKAELRRQAPSAAAAQPSGFLAWFREQIADTRRAMAWMGSAAAVAALALMLGITALRTPYFSVAMVGSTDSTRSGGNVTLAGLAKAPVEVKLAAAKQSVRLLFEGGVVLEGWARQVETDPKAATFLLPLSFAVGMAGRLPSGEPVTGTGFITYGLTAGTTAKRLTPGAVSAVMLNVTLRTADGTSQEVARTLTFQAP